MQPRTSSSSVLAVLLLIAFPGQAAETLDLWSAVDTNRVCAVTTVWRLGTTRAAGPFDMIETVTPLDVEGRAVWRVMHTMLRGIDDFRRGSAPGSDVFDIDRATLAPLQSEHRSGGGTTPLNVTRFEFPRNATELPPAVRRLDGDGSIAERIALEPGQRVLVSGPGDAILDQAIGWSDGLKLRAYTLDRWRGRERERLREIEVAVTGRSAVEVGGRRVETFVVDERPLDGSYHVTSMITVERPHRRVQSQYYAAGRKDGARPFVSEAVVLMQDASCGRDE